MEQKVEWIWGEPGSGKTYYVREKENSLWRLDAFERYNVFKKYKNEEAILIDGYDPNSYDFAILFNILNRREIQDVRIYITSLDSPDTYFTPEQIELLKINKIIHTMKTRFF